MDQLEIARAKNRQYCQAWRSRNRKTYNTYQRNYYLKRKRVLTKIAVKARQAQLTAKRIAT